MRDDKALHTPWGLIRPVDVIGMWAHRHMHEFGTTREHFGNVAIAARKHAQRNPFAMMRGRPLDMETYLAGRVIGYPLTLYDCCLETDGALACIVTTVERARDLRQKPVLIHSVAQASGPNPVHLANYNNSPAHGDDVARGAPSCSGSGRSSVRRTWTARRSTTPSRRWSSSGLEDYGFCKRGEGGPFTEGGRIEIGGALPVLTSGGGLSEAYVHGFNLRARRRAADPRHVGEPGAGLQGDAGDRRVGRGDQRRRAAGRVSDGRVRAGRPAAPSRLPAARRRRSR